MVFEEAIVFGKYKKRSGFYSCFVSNGLLSEKLVDFRFF